MNKKNIIVSKLEERIWKIAELFEDNHFLLESILIPFDIVYELPLSKGYYDIYWRTDLGWYDKESSSYDSTMQVLTHIE